jgi:hypothetical protein
MNQQLTEAEMLLEEEGLDFTESSPNDPTEFALNLEDSKPLKPGDKVYGMGQELATRQGGMKQELQVTVTNNDDPGFTTMWQVVEYMRGRPVVVASKVRKTAIRYYRAKGFLPRRPADPGPKPELEQCDYCQKQLILGQKENHMRAVHGGDYAARLAYEDRQDKNALAQLLVAQQEQNRLLQEQIAELQSAREKPTKEK